MKSTVLGLLVAALACLFAQRAVACPACTIYNLLDKAVQESPNIFCGEVLRPPVHYQVEVKVLKVLKGTYEVGSMVVAYDRYRYDWHVGDKFIFCDSSSYSTSLDLEIEEEILFLLHGKPAATNLEEAIRRVQGVSVETHKRGMEYIAAHHAAAVKPLLAELDALVPRVFSNEDVFFGEHRLASLTEALLLKPTEEGKAFVFCQIDAFPDEPSSPFGRKAGLILFFGAIGVSVVLAGFLGLGTRVFLPWTSPRRLWAPAIFVAVPTVFLAGLAHYWCRSLPYLTASRVYPGLIVPWLLLAGCLCFVTRVFLRRPFPHGRRSLLIFVAATSAALMCAAWYTYPVPRYASARANILRDMLRPTTKHQELLTAVREHMFEMCAQRQGSALAEAVYAMALAKVAWPHELQVNLTNEDAADMLALGLFFAGNERSSQWRMGDAHDFWDKALSVAQTRRLKTAIAKQIAAHPERKHMARTSDRSGAMNTALRCLVAEFPRAPWGRLFSDAVVLRGGPEDFAAVVAGADGEVDV